MAEHALSAPSKNGGQAVCAAPTVPAVDPPSAFLKIAAHPAGDRTFVAVSGEIDIETEQVLQRALCEALNQSTSGVDLDLTGVEFCDCSGLNVLLRIRRLALAGAKTVDIRATGLAVEKLFARTRISSLFTPARAPHTNGAIDGKHPVTTHIRTEKDGLPDDAEQELRIEVVQLKRAMQTRPVIDLARGVLMASFGLSAEDAWSVLVGVSQHTNTKLHHLAEELVGAVNGEPLPEPLQRQLSTAVAQASNAH